MPQSTRLLFLAIWVQLSQRRKIQLCFLFFVILVSGVSELVSLGSIFPFLTVISAPESAWNHHWTQILADWININTPKDLIFPFAFIFAVTAVVATSVRLFNLWLNGQLAAAIGSDLSCSVYTKTLCRPYLEHIKSDSSAVITGTTTHVVRTVQALSVFLKIVTSAIVSIFLLLGILAVNWRAALFSILLFGTIYFLFAINSRKQLASNSKSIANASRQQIKAIQEGLGAIRDVLLNSYQDQFVNIYRNADLPQRRLLAKNEFLSTFPRYIVEGLGLVVIACLGGFLAFQQESDGTIVPLLGTLALGAQRILPAFQQVYNGWSRLKGFNADLERVVDMLNQQVSEVPRVRKLFKLKGQIIASDLYFAYGDNEPNVLCGINLVIDKGERIGIIGSTGSGKSTLIDVLMGLLPPKSGSVIVDNTNLYDEAEFEALSTWKASIAHVPQSLFLSDSSIAENIAFGTPHDKINYDLVQKSAKQAMISSFIESLPNGYDTHVGERGIRLSGGQCQRIGIARALYKNSTILFLDEATSALDTKTEESVIDVLENLDNEVTVIMVAHRLTTLRRCSRVICIEHGVVSSISSPEEILREL